MTILVTGATGNVGRNVVAHLIENGHAVRALTRNPSKAGLPAGVEVVQGDLTDPSTLDFTGVTALHLITVDVSGGYAPLETGSELIAMAKEAGVRKVTVLRGGAYGTIENALLESDLEWTFIAPVEFMSGVFDWAATIRDDELVRAPFPEVLSAMVHDGDIGAVIATVLTSDGHAGKTYDLTGPAALSIRDKVAAISTGLGREITYLEQTEEEARQEWKEQGLPDEVIEFFVMAHGNPPEMAYTVTTTVEQITGRPARTLQQFVATHAARF